MQLVRPSQDNLWRGDAAMRISNPNGLMNASFEIDPKLDSFSRKRHRREALQTIFSHCQQDRSDGIEKEDVLSSIFGEEPT
jgi:hypothetical protein